MRLIHTAGLASPGIDYHKPHKIWFNDLQEAVHMKD